MTEKAKKVFVNLYVKGKDNYTGEKDGKYYYVFPATSKDGVARKSLYYLLVFKDKANFDKKCAGERINADLIAWIWEKEKDWRTWLWGMLSDDGEKKSYWIGLYDNKLKSPGKDNDKLLTLTETEYRERNTGSSELEENGLPF